MRGLLLMVTIEEPNLEQTAFLDDNNDLPVPVEATAPAPDGINPDGESDEADKLAQFELSDSETLYVDINRLRIDASLCPPGGVTPSRALQIVKEHEAVNVAFDLAYAEADEIASWQKFAQEALEEIANLEWGQPNDIGELRLNSVWSGGLNEGGIQYRFVPAAV